MRSLPDLALQDFYEGPFADFHESDSADVRWDVEPLWRLLPDPSTGAILDIGSGAGRLAVPLADSGWRVCGVDRSARAVERLKASRSESPARTDRLCVVEGDVLDPGLDLSGPFAAALLGDLSINAFHSDSQVLTLFERAAAVLKPEGQVLFVVLDDRSHMRMTMYDGRIRAVPFTDFSGERHILWTVFRFDQDHQMLYGNVLLELRGDDPPSTSFHFSATAQRIWTPHLIEPLIRAAGFRLMARNACAVNGGGLDGAGAYAMAAIRGR